MTLLRPLLAVVLVAGCLAPAPSAAPVEPTDVAGAAEAAPPPEDGAAPPAAPAPSPEARSADPAPALVQRGCTTTFALSFLPEALAQGRAPEGFAMAEWQSGTTPYALKAWRCASSTGSGLDVADATLVVHYWAVVPPAELAGDAGVWWLPLGCAASDEGLAALFASWDIPCAAGAVALEEQDGLVRVTARAGAVAVDLVTRTGSGAEADGYVARYFGVADGRATWAVDIPVSPSVTGSGDGAYVVGDPRAPVPSAPVDSASLQRFDEGVSYLWIAHPPGP